MLFLDLTGSSSPARSPFLEPPGLSGVVSIPSRIPPCAS